MGRELRRVPLDFDWPLDKAWAGFINPYSDGAVKCAACNGDGYSKESRLLADKWYGHVPFSPEERGSTPFLPTDKCVIERVMWNAKCSDPNNEHVMREAARLCEHFNSSWMHHLNENDVSALLEAKRLIDLTHTWKQGEGWKPKNPPHRPTAREVNEWSLVGFGHDSLNQWIVCRAECNALGIEYRCPVCEGHGEIWHSEAAKKLHEGWRPKNPPKGKGYQIWETVSEGSPISPVYKTPEELAQWMANNGRGLDNGTSYETWLAFINGPGWAPSLISDSSGVRSGVSGVITAPEE